MGPTLRWLHGRTPLSPHTVTLAFYPFYTSRNCEDKQPGVVNGGVWLCAKSAWLELSVFVAASQISQGDLCTGLLCPPGSEPGVSYIVVQSEWHLLHFGICPLLRYPLSV